jgi:NTP pyrophosphatase (non-canonical NTP hydrolase)
MSKSLNQLRNDAYDNAIAKGFWDKPPSVAESIALMHSELSEALEDDCDGRRPDEMWHTPVTTGVMAKPCGIPSEMADVIIRVLDFCGHYNIDIEAVVIEKMLFNSTRPTRHGKKF